MADIDDQTLRDFTRSMTDLAGAMGKLGQNFDSGAKTFEDFKKSRKQSETDAKRQKRHEKEAKAFDPDRIGNRLTATFDKWDKGIRGLTGGTEAVGSAFKELAKKIGGGAIGGVLVGGLTDYFSGLHKTYLGLADIGQDFGGNMMQMAQAAAESGLSLAQYADLLKKQSAVAAQMGKSGGGLGMLAKQVRDSSMQFGMFNYSIEGLNDLTGDYMETMRRSGLIQDLTDAQTKKMGDSIRGLANTTTQLAETFGKSRTEITKQAQEIMRSSLFASRQNELGAAGATKAMNSIGTAITTFAAQMGPAGSLIGQMLADLHGIGDSSFAFHTDAAKVFQEAGMGQLTGMVANFYDSVKDMNEEEAKKASLEFNNQLKDQIGDPRTLDFLRKQALLGHNQAAKQVLDLYLNLKKVDQEKEALARKAAQGDPGALFTQQMNNMANAWGDFSGKVREMFYRIITPALPVLKIALEKFNALLMNPKVAAAMDSLGKVMGALVQKAVDWLTGLAGPEMSNFTKYIESWTSSLNGASESTTSFSGILDKFVLEPLKSLGASIVNTIGDSIAAAFHNFDLIDLIKTRFTTKNTREVPSADGKSTESRTDWVEIMKKGLFALVAYKVGKFAFKLIGGIVSKAKSLGSILGLGGAAAKGGILGSVLGGIGASVATMNVNAAVVNINGPTNGGLGGGLGGGPGGKGPKSGPGGGKLGKLGGLLQGALSSAGSYGRLAAALLTIAQMAPDVTALTEEGKKNGESKSGAEKADGFLDMLKTLGLSLSQGLIPGLAYNAGSAAIDGVMRPGDDKITEWKKKGYDPDAGIIGIFQRLFSPNADKARAEAIGRATGEKVAEAVTAGDANKAVGAAVASAIKEGIDFNRYGKTAARMEGAFDRMSEGQQRLYKRMLEFSPGQADDYLKRKMSQTEDEDQIKAFMERMGMKDTSSWRATMEGNVPTSINGVAVPKDLYSDEQKAQIDAAREMSAAMGNSAPVPKLLTDKPAMFGPNLPPGVTPEQLAAKVTDAATQQVSTSIARPRDEADPRLAELDRLNKKQADLERQAEDKNNTEEQNRQLITEIQQMQKLIREQTEVLVRQNREQTDVLKQSRNKLERLEDNFGG